ncbi:hypothetical protein Q4561_11525 [Alteromonas sp. 1_MG-2023]|uniref:hypothetical protein n=1 Tax=Alteromonas sp. 1_MG-2023 TaxID=3062669 RepID=UPI0026E40B70|nr:hypothetical protein [Alteromonas sp. 1_MG-2023]MDO6567689.1 hypothetical protein [Alteromonas sp. 1_MG-2023]
MPASKHEALKRYTLFLFIIVLVGAAYYFLRIQQNEIQQNHSYLRQLNEAGKSLQQSINMLLTSVKEEIKPRETKTKTKTKNESDFKKRISSNENFKHLGIVDTPESEKKNGVSTEGVTRNEGSITNVEFDAKSRTFKIQVRSEAKDKTVTVPIADLISKHLSPFPLLVISDDKGEVIAEKRHRNLAKALSDLRFSNVGELLGENEESGEATGQDEKVRGRGVKASDSVDRKIAGLYLRVYRQPITITDLNAGGKDDSKTLYLLAFVEKKEVVLNNLKIGNNTALWIVLFLTLLVATLPILKIQYCAPTYSYTRSDVTQCILGLFILLGVATIAISDQLFFRYWLQQKAVDTENIHRAISTDFSIELAQLLKLDHRYFDKASKGDNSGCTSFEAISKSNETTDLLNCRLINEQKEANGQAYFIENWFLLNNKGFVTGYEDTSPPMIVRPHENLYSAKKTNLQTREYYQRAWHGSMWRLDTYLIGEFYKKNYPIISLFEKSANLVGKGEVFKGCCEKLLIDAITMPQQFFIERIRNIDDARFNSQLVFKRTFNGDKEGGGEGEKEAKVHVSSIGTLLTSLNRRILPKNIGYAVIDTTGKVLYHSNEERSLVENFVAESGHDLQLLTTISNLKNINVDEPARLFLDYRGAEHSMVIGPLHSAIPEWALVVFYNQEEASQVNMLLVFLAVILYLTILIPLLLICRYVSSQGVWARLFHYQNDDNDTIKSSQNANTSIVSRTTYRWLALWIWSACTMQLFTIGVINSVLPRLAFLFLMLTVILIFLQFIFVPVEAQGKKVSFTALTCRYLFRPSTLIKMPFFIPFVCFLMLTALSVFSGGENTSHSHVPHANEHSLIFPCIGIGLFVVFTILMWMKSVAGGVDDTLSNKKPRSLSELSRRVPSSYIWYLAGSIYIVTVVPAVILVNSVNSYMLEGQATFQNQHLLEMHQKVSAANQQYRALMHQDLTSYREGLASTTSAIPFKTIFPALKREEWVTLDSATAFSSVLNNNTDNFINAIISSLNLQTNSAAEYRFKAGTELTTTSDKMLHYSAQKFMRASSASYFYQLVLITTVFIFSVFCAALLLISRKLLGEHLFDSYRLRPPSEAEESEYIWKQLSPLQSKNMQIQFISQLSQTDLEKAFKKQNHTIFKNRVDDIQGWLTREKEINFREIAKIDSHKDTPTIVLKGLNKALLDLTEREAAFTLIQSLQQRKCHLILVSEMSPMQLLSHAAHFPAFEAEHLPSKNELWQWSKLLRSFSIHYHWVASKKNTLTTSPTAFSVLSHESTHWHDLQSVQKSFLIYHLEIKQKRKGEDIDELLNRLNHTNITEQKMARLALELDKYWSPQQIVEYFVHHARPSYRLRWEQCTTNERLILLQLAQGAKLNPASAEIIGHLQRRGLIYRDCGWHLINESFRQFVLTAEPAKQIQEWLAETRSSIWHNLRPPLFMLVGLLFLLVIFSANIAFDSIITTLAAVLGVLPMLITNLTSLRTLEILPKD